MALADLSTVRGVRDAVASGHISAVEACSGAFDAIDARDPALHAFNTIIKEEAIAEAGSALANMGRNELALDQYRKGLQINSRNPIFRRQARRHA